MRHPGFHLRSLGGLQSRVNAAIIAIAGSTTSSPTSQSEGPMADNTAIRSFHFEAPQADLTDLRARVKATKWPDREQVNDPSQGVQLATMQKLSDYWLNQHDWRRCEAKINAVPNFVTEISGLDFHFIHVRFKHENALPMIISQSHPARRSRKHTHSR
jgi:hypothetical protein